MLYILRAGLKLDDVQWVEIGEDISPAFRKAQFEMIRSGKADAALITGGTAQYEEAGCHVLQLEPLPMINGPTLTTAITALERKDRLGERMVKAIVMGIHFARAHREETERILEGLRSREPEAGSVRYESLTRMPIKPYPAVDAVANAYELCLMKIPEAKDFSPLALWDTHYLRDLDQSGFIDGLYR
jgi:ABC-type nitrate/sulfonate/bicarbonate transport system substrate-binding protein